jgi:hypothetical protein
LERKGVFLKTSKQRKATKVNNKLAECMQGVSTEENESKMRAMIQRARKERILPHSIPLLYVEEQQVKRTASKEVQMMQTEAKRALRASDLNCSSYCF